MQKSKFEGSLQQPYPFRLSHRVLNMSSTQKPKPNFETRVIKLGDQSVKGHFERIKNSLSPLRNIRQSPNAMANLSSQSRHTNLMMAQDQQFLQKQLFRKTTKNTNNVLATNHIISGFIWKISEQEKIFESYTNNSRYQYDHRSGSFSRGPEDRRTLEQSIVESRAMSNNASQRKQDQTNDDYRYGRQMVRTPQVIRKIDYSGDDTLAGKIMKANSEFKRLDVSPTKEEQFTHMYRKAPTLGLDDNISKKPDQATSQYPPPTQVHKKNYDSTPKQSRFDQSDQQNFKQSHPLQIDDVRSRFINPSDIKVINQKEDQFIEESPLHQSISEPRRADEYQRKLSQKDQMEQAYTSNRVESISDKNPGQFRQSFSNNENQIQSGQFSTNTNQQSFDGYPPSRQSIKTPQQQRSVEHSSRNSKVPTFAQQQQEEFTYQDLPQQNQRKGNSSRNNSFDNQYEQNYNQKSQESSHKQSDLSKHNSKQSSYIQAPQNNYDVRSNNTESVQSRPIESRHNDQSKQNSKPRMSQYDLEEIELDANTSNQQSKKIDQSVSKRGTFVSATQHQSVLEKSVEYQQPQSEQGNRSRYSSKAGISQNDVEDLVEYEAIKESQDNKSSRNSKKTTTLHNRDDNDNDQPPSNKKSLDITQNSIKSAKEQQKAQMQFEDEEFDQLDDYSEIKKSKEIKKPDTRTPSKPASQISVRGDNFETASQPKSKQDTVVDLLNDTRTSQPPAQLKKVQEDEDSLSQSNLGASDDNKSQTSSNLGRQKKKKKKAKKVTEEQQSQKETTQYLNIYEVQIKKYDIIGKTAAQCIKHFQAQKNFWIIPLFIVFKRMMFFRQTTLKQNRKELETKMQEENLFNLEQSIWKQLQQSEAYIKMMGKVSTENGIVIKELETLHQMAQAMVKKLDPNVVSCFEIVQEAKKIDKYINTDFNQNIQDIYFIYLYTQIYKTVKQQNSKNIDEKKSIEEIKLLINILCSIIISELPFCIDDPIYFDLDDHQRNLNATELKALQHYQLSKEESVNELKERLTKKGIKI